MHDDRQDIPFAETVYPTKEQFSDPISYIESIRHIGERTGVVCIVPPEGWEPPFALDPSSNPSEPSGASPSSPAHAEGDGLHFQVRKQFTSSLCIREPKAASACMGGNGASHVSPVAAGRMSGGGGRMSGGAMGRMSGGGGSRMFGSGGGRRRMGGVSPAIRQLSLNGLTPGPPGRMAFLSSISPCHPTQPPPAAVVDDSMRHYPEFPLPMAAKTAPATAVSVSQGSVPKPTLFGDSNTSQKVDAEGLCCSIRMIPPPPASDDVSIEMEKGLRLPAAVIAPSGPPGMRLALARSHLLPHPLFDGVPEDDDIAKAKDASVKLILAASGVGRSAPTAAAQRPTRASARATVPSKRRRWLDGDSDTEDVADDKDGETTETETEGKNGSGRQAKWGGQRRATKGESSSGSDTETDDDGLFGHAIIEHKHTLKSFMAYAEWSKTMHFGSREMGREETMNSSRRVSQDNNESGGHWVGDDWLRAVTSRTGRPHSQSSLRVDGGAEAAENGVWGEGSPTVLELESEFWRIVEDPSLDVETLYGSDLDSGR